MPVRHQDPRASPPPVPARLLPQPFLRSVPAHPLPQPVLQSRPANGILSRRERLKTWRKNLGCEMDVPSDVILPRDVLETIAEVGPRNDAELEALMKDLPARYHRFGKKILEISLNESE